MMKQINTHKEQLVLLKFIGSTLFAWAAIDVFVVGAIVTVYEMASGSFTYSSPFFSKLIHGLRSNLEIPGEHDVIMTLRPKLCAGAYLTSLSAFAIVGIGVQFIGFLGRLQTAAPLEESDGAQQEVRCLQVLPQGEAAPLEESDGARQEVCLQVLPRQEAAPLLSAARGRSFDPEDR